MEVKQLLVKITSPRGVAISCGIGGLAFLGTGHYWLGCILLVVGAFIAMIDGTSE